MLNRLEEEYSLQFHGNIYLIESHEDIMRFIVNQSFHVDAKEIKENTALMAGHYSEIYPVKQVKLRSHSI